MGKARDFRRTRQGFSGPVAAPAAVAFVRGTFAVESGGFLDASGFAVRNAMATGGSIAAEAAGFEIAGIVAAGVGVGVLLGYGYMHGFGGWMVSAVSNPYGGFFGFGTTCTQAVPGPPFTAHRIGVQPAPPGWAGKTINGCVTDVASNFAQQPWGVTVPKQGGTVHIDEAWSRVANLRGGTGVHGYTGTMTAPLVHTGVRTGEGFPTPFDSPLEFARAVTIEQTETRTAFADPEFGLQPWQRPAVTFDVPPDGPPGVSDTPHDLKPPGRGERERKFKVAVPVAVAHLISVVTEAEQAVDCVVKNIHAWRRIGGPRGFSWTNKPRAPYRMKQHEKLQWIAQHADGLDPVGLVQCLVVNEVEDRVIGRVARAAQRAYFRANPGALHGPQLGPAL